LVVNVGYLGSQPYGLPVLNEIFADSGVMIVWFFGICCYDALAVIKGEITEMTRIKKPIL